MHRVGQRFTGRLSNRDLRVPMTTKCGEPIFKRTVNSLTRSKPRQEYYRHLWRNMWAN